MNYLFTFFHCHRLELLRSAPLPIHKVIIIAIFYLLVISVYLSSLPVAHLSDAPGRRLLDTGDSARVQDETTENTA